MPQPFDPKLNTEWKLLNDNFDLHPAGASQLAKNLPEESGVYLWTTKYNNDEHTLYIGKATSLNKRIYNYSQSFQPHSPNDRKLYFAQTAIREIKPNACFPLYWKPVPVKELNRVEQFEINLFKPLLNEKKTYSVRHRELLEATYALLYREVIKKHFSH